MPQIKGTASIADSRALSKALKATKFPESFNSRVDLSVLNRSVLAQWIENKVYEILGFEDDIVALTAVNLFLPTGPEDGAAPEVDPRKAQIDMTGFLGEEQGAVFAQEVWELMLDAQTAPMGIPKKLLEEKKKELAQAKSLEPAAAPPPAEAARRPPPQHHAPHDNGHPHQRQRPSGRRPISPPGGEDRRSDWRGDRRVDDSRRGRRPDYDEFGRHWQGQQGPSPPVDYRKRLPPAPDRGDRRYRGREFDSRESDRRGPLPRREEERYRRRPDRSRSRSRSRSPNRHNSPPARRRSRSLSSGSSSSSSSRSRSRSSSSDSGSRSRSSDSSSASSRSGKS